ncbi:hypothetical protein ACIRPX_27020 [Streptomyces sp. NPDC101225]|uniref:hypothetical protein n=1 Tax=Streptomyces sp. NPDC101225 TaxID=3366135 RepID=UPI0037FCB0BA
MATTTPPPSPQPTGDPRWVALFHGSSPGTWRVCAESPHRAPVQYALGEMAQTVRARGGTLAVSLWGPQDGAWRRFDVQAAAAPVPRPPAGPEEPSRLSERMDARKRQVLMAGLSKAGLYDLASDDHTAVQALVERLDETTVRRVAGWLAAAGGGAVSP